MTGSRGRRLKQRERQRYNVAQVCGVVGHTRHCRKFEPRHRSSTLVSAVSSRCLVIACFDLCNHQPLPRPSGCPTSFDLSSRHLVRLPLHPFQPAHHPIRRAAPRPPNVSCQTRARNNASRNDAIIKPPLRPWVPADVPDRRRRSIFQTIVTSSREFISRCAQFMRQLG